MPLTQSSENNEELLSHSMGKICLQIWYYMFFYYQQRLLTVLEQDGLYFKFSLMVQEQVEDFQTWLRIEGGTFFFS